MPLVRVDLRNGKPADYRRAIADAVHQCMVNELKAPADDRFQVIAEHAFDSLAAQPGLRTQDVLTNLIEVAKENWSSGDGIAQYAPEEKA